MTKVLQYKESAVKTFVLHYALNLALLYVPLLVFPGVELIEGVMGMRKEVFYEYGYYFLFLITIAQVVTHQRIASLPRKRGRYIMLYYGVTAYLDFVTFSVLFIAVRSAAIKPTFALGETPTDFVAFFVEALAVGVPVILFSPLTYMMAITHLLIYRFFFIENDFSLTEDSKSP